MPLRDPTRRLRAADRGRGSGLPLKHSELSGTVVCRQQKGVSFPGEGSDPRGPERAH